MIKKASSSLEQAQEYYNLGFSLIPLIQKTKREAVSLYGFPPGGG
jgi:hypothetical protein